MYRIFFIVFLWLTLFSHNLFSQSIPENYFRNPLDTPILLAGSFGELRPNHFHTGIDIKTGGKEGMPVYAAADGYISLMSISGYGYGHMLMINHPIGYTTVYGHLQSYIPILEDYIKKEQYRRKQFQIELHPTPQKFPVKKGDLIGYSGNTGSSAAPHLHFEIRNTKLNQPVNPLIYSFEVKDTIKPTLTAIKIYPMDTASWVAVYYKNRKSPVIARAEESVKIRIVQKNGKRFLSGIDKIEAGGNIGFSIDGFDKKNDSYNIMGIYTIELCVDEERLYYSKMQQIDFSLKHFIKAHVDYAERIKHHQWFQKSFILPGNVLPIYKVKQNGILQTESGKSYSLTYYVSDENGNTSVLPIHIESPALPFSLPPLKKELADTIIPFGKDISFNKPGLSVLFNKNTFYKDVPLIYKELPQPHYAWSPLYEVGTLEYAVNQPFQIAIQAINLPERLWNKAFIFSYQRGWLPGIMKDNIITANSDVLGKFCIRTDTIPPTISPVNIYQNKNMSREKNIRFTIRDDLSGLNNYNGYIDGSWVLFEYDPRKSLIWYTFDEHVTTGKHSLEIIVTDREDNVKKLSFDFIR